MPARLVPALLLAVCAAALSGCSDQGISFLDPQGPIAADQREHLLRVVGLLTIVVLPVIVLAPFIAWRYRYRENEGEETDVAYQPNWSFSWPVEFVIWGVPVAIVAILSTILWFSVHALDPFKPLASDTPPTRVQAVGYDWKWLFIYPDEGFATVGEMAFPDDRPVSMTLTSDTVMQSFSIPSLGSQIYAMGGMVTALNLSADQPGTFLGQNTQYSGMGFQHQKFSARAMAPDDYAAWTAKMQAEAIPLDARIYEILATRNTPEEFKALVETPDGAPAADADIESPPTKVVPGSVVALGDVPRSLFDAVVIGTMEATPPSGILDLAAVTPPGSAMRHDGKLPALDEIQGSDGLQGSICIGGYDVAENTR